MPCAEDSQNLSCRTDKFYSLYYIVLGHTTPLPLSHCVCLLRLTSKPVLCYRSCAFFSELLIGGTLMLTSAQC